MININDLEQQAFWWTLRIKSREPLNHQESIQFSRFLSVLTGFLEREELKRPPPHPFAGCASDDLAQWEK